MTVSSTASPVVDVAMGDNRQGGGVVVLVCPIKSTSDRRHDEAPVKLLSDWAMVGERGDITL